jgi:hypothetical protein
VLAVRDLVQDPRLGERERRLEVAVAQEADLARVETTEPPDVGDTPIERGLPTACRGIVADVNKLVDYVKSMEPVGDLAVGEPGRIELGLPHFDDRDANDVPALERLIRRDVDPLDRKRPVKADPAQRAMRLVAEVAARTLVERHLQRRRAVRAQAREGEATPKASPEHG